MPPAKKRSPLETAREAPAVTLKDVALRAGVHHSIVGRVLAGDPRKKIQDETRARILQAAEDLGYRRNLLASRMRSGRRDLALVLCARGPEALQNPAYQTIATALQVALARDGRCLVTHFYAPETRPFLKENLHESLYEGMVLMGSEVYPEIEALAVRIPALQIFHDTGSPVRSHLFLDPATTTEAVVAWAGQEGIRTLRPVACMRSPLYLKRLADFMRGAEARPHLKVLPPAYLSDRTEHQQTREELLHLFEHLPATLARDLVKGTDGLVDFGGEGMSLRLFLERSGVRVPGEVKMLVTGATAQQALWYPDQAFLMEEPRLLSDRILAHFKAPTPGAVIRVPTRLWRGRELLAAWNP